MFLEIEQKLDKANKIIEELKEALEKQQKKLKLKPKYDLSHLIQDSQFVFGPVQDDEALLLFGAIKTIRPKVIVEFGANNGFGSLNFLKAIDEDSKLYSYDINPFNKDSLANEDKRFIFYRKSHSDFDQMDVGNQTIDFVFVDYAHTDTMKTGFKKIINQISFNGIIAIHNTGLHVSEQANCVCDYENYCGGAHQKDARAFINWIIENYTEWHVLEMHSFKIFRHGLTFLQKIYQLSEKQADSSNCKSSN